VVHGGRFIHPNTMLLSTSTFLADYKSAMEKDVVEGEIVVV
jgi:hypothetical protein